LLEIKEKVSSGGGKKREENLVWGVKKLPSFRGTVPKRERIDPVKNPHLRREGREKICIRKGKEREPPTHTRKGWFTS